MVPKNDSANINTIIDLLLRLGEVELSELIYKSNKKK
jgi:hypothetical protein